MWWTRENGSARALANCVDCQTFAAAFQIVLVPLDWDTFIPHNEAFAGNLACEGNRDVRRQRTARSL